MRYTAGIRCCALAPAHLVLDVLAAIVLAVGVLQPARGVDRWERFGQHALSQAGDQPGSCSVMAATADPNLCFPGMVHLVGNKTWLSTIAAYTLATASARDWH